jgi:hypothetical protein
MPYKSDAQRKLFHAKAAKGEIKPEVVDEFDQASKGMELPPKVKSKGGRPPKSLADLKAASRKMESMEPMPDMESAMEDQAEMKPKKKAFKSLADLKALAGKKRR